MTVHGHLFIMNVHWVSPVCWVVCQLGTRWWSEATLVLHWDLHLVKGHSGSSGNHTCNGGNAGKQRDCTARALHEDMWPKLGNWIKRSSEVASLTRVEGGGMFQKPRENSGHWGCVRVLSTPWEYWAGNVLTEQQATASPSLWELTHVWETVLETGEETITGWRVGRGICGQI